MPYFLKKLLSKQSFADQATAIAARWLNIILLLLITLILANSAAILVGWLDQANMVLILATNGIALVAFCTIWLIMRMGYVNTAAFILLAILYILITYINAIVFRSIRTPNVMTYFALIPLTGLLVGQRNMNRVAMLCIVTIGIIFYCEWVGILIPSLESRSLFDDLVVLFLAIVVNTVLLNASVRRVEDKADIIQQTAALLAQTNYDLEQSQKQLQIAQTGLEQKVAQRTEELRHNNAQLQQEITQRQQLVDALVKSEANWRTLAEQVPEVIIRIEPDHTISFINRQIAGQKPEDLLNSSVHTIHEQPKYKTLLTEAIDRVLQSGAVVTYEMIEGTGDQQSWHINRVSTITENGKIAAAILISTDISEQKRAEAAMYQAQKLESLGVLAGGVAHDFNNLLTIIVMQTSLALKQVSGNKIVQQKLERVMDATKRATELTKQMLNYAGRNRLDIQKFDLNELITGNAHLFSSAIPKNIKIHTCLDESNLYVSGDRVQIQQIIMNLILNAADAINPNQGSIQITTRFKYHATADMMAGRWVEGEVPAGNYISITIEDNGCGMDTETLEKIFDPFFTTKVTGRGLGLASVIGIVRSHKGGLHVSSSIGKGTQFTILLPAALATDESRREEKKADVSFTASQELVLIIDDEEMIREGVAEVLTDANLRVLTAADGLEGVQKFHDHVNNLSLVLLDLALPEMNGEAVFQKLQQIDPQIPVIIMSGHPNERMLERICDLEQAEFIHKPPTTNLLLQTVKNKLRRMPPSPERLSYWPSEESTEESTEEMVPELIKSAVP